MKLRVTAALALLSLGASSGCKYFSHKRFIPPFVPGAAVLSAPRFAERPYQLLIPPPETWSGPRPLVLALHGFGSTGSELASYLDLPAVTRQHGAILVLVDGQKDQDGHRFWNSPSCCDDYDTRPDDMGYLRAVLDDVAARAPVDPKRVYLLGFSNGAMMAHVFACANSERVAAFVSLSGATPIDAARCAPKSRLSVLEVHGDRDDMVWYDGGSFGSEEGIANLARHGVQTPATLTKIMPYTSAADTARGWAEREGCKVDAPVTTDPPKDLDAKIAGAETTVVRYPGCASGVDVELWTIHDGPHVPTPADGLGEALYGFLEAHAKR